MGLDVNIDRAPSAVRLDKIDSWEEIARMQKEGLVAEACYWRKYQQVIWWMERNVYHETTEDCRYYRVTREELAKLGQDCLAALADHQKFGELFEGDAYDLEPSEDEDCWCDRERLVDTAEQVARALADAGSDDAFWFSASW